jgi:hypothetical protein
MKADPMVPRIVSGDPVPQLQNLATRLGSEDVQLRWELNTRDHPTCVLYQVIDNAGRVWGSSPTSQQALRAAERNILHQLPAWKRTLSVWNWTLDEFRRHTLVIPVVTGRGKTGAATTGDVRLLVGGDGSALHELRADLKQMHESLPAPDKDDIDRWVSNSLGNLLAGDMGGSDCTYMDGGVRPWIFAKEAVIGRGIDVCRMTHRMEIEAAMARGEPIHDVVIADYPDLSPDKPTPTRMRA